MTDHDTGYRLRLSRTSAPGLNKTRSSKERGSWREERFSQTGRDPGQNSSVSNHNPLTKTVSSHSGLQSQRPTRSVRIKQNEKDWSREAGQNNHQGHPSHSPSPILGPQPSQTQTPSFLPELSFQLVDFFQELKHKIVSSGVNRSKKLNEFLNTDFKEVKEYTLKDPVEFLQIIESICLVHIDKLGYRNDRESGGKYWQQKEQEDSSRPADSSLCQNCGCASVPSPNTNQAPNPALERTTSANIFNPSRAPILSKGHSFNYPNPGINSNQLQKSPKNDIIFKSKYTNLVIKKMKPGEVDAFGNKKLYDMVFKQEDREDECYDVMRIATDMKFLEQQKVGSNLSFSGVQRTHDLRKCRKKEESYSAIDED